MKNREGAFREIRSSPEVQAYATWLKEEKAKNTDGSLPSVEKRKVLKKAFRYVSERKSERENVNTEKKKADAERTRTKERGEARLREIVERKELPEIFVNHLEPV